MAMNVGQKNGIVAEINVTPMIDLLLVLIIIFMVVNASLKSTGEQAQLPQPAPMHGQVPPPDRTIVVEIVASGDKPLLRINQESVEWGQFRARLFDIYKQRAERVMFLQADDAVLFARVAEVIDVAHADFKDMRVGLMTTRMAHGG